MEFYKTYDRRQGGSWGKPHKDVRTDANQATRHLQSEETRELMKIKIEDMEAADVPATQ